MTNKTFLPLLIFTITSVFYAQQAASDTFSYHSAICEAITPAQSAKMEWREAGLINKDPNNSLWVMCPMPIKVEDHKDVNFGVAIGNSGNTVVDVDCILRVFNDDGKLKSHSYTLRVGPGEVNSKTWDIDDEVFWPAIQCNLPPNTVLRGLEGRY
ncbi:MAG: hypothetical protein IMF06_15495 [Proteobacteria bacterium]|nr:hypothetical protein [Pseudomonadota bacterium]